jgi:DNA-binding LacI/PurR family transcriptional regulator
MLLGMIQGPEEPAARIELPTELVIRESCRMRAGP